MSGEGGPEAKAAGPLFPRGHWNASVSRRLEEKDSKLERRIMGRNITISIGGLILLIIIVAIIF